MITMSSIIPLFIALFLVTVAESAPSRSQPPKPTGEGSGELPSDVGNSAKKNGPLPERRSGDPPRGRYPIEDFMRNHPEAGWRPGSGVPDYPVMSIPNEIDDEVASEDFNPFLERDGSTSFNKDHNPFLKDDEEANNKDSEDDDLVKNKHGSSNPEEDENGDGHGVGEEEPEDYDSRVKIEEEAPKDDYDEVHKVDEDDHDDEGLNHEDDGKVAPFHGAFIFDTPFFNVRQVSKYFQQMEKALEHVFRETMDEAALLNGTYANTTEEEVEIEGKKYLVQKSVIKGKDNNSSVYIEALTSVPKGNATKELEDSGL